MKSEAMANTTLFHTAELRAMNARTVTRVGANFVKPIPRLVREKKNSFYAQFKKV